MEDKQLPSAQKLHFSFFNLLAILEEALSSHRLRLRRSECCHDAPAVGYLDLILKLHRRGLGGYPDLAEWNLKLRKGGAKRSFRQRKCHKPGVRWRWTRVSRHDPWARLSIRLETAHQCQRWPLQIANGKLPRAT